MRKKEVKGGGKKKKKRSLLGGLHGIHEHTWHRSDFIRFYIFKNDVHIHLRDIYDLIRFGLSPMTRCSGKC